MTQLAEALHVLHQAEKEDKGKGPHKMVRPATLQAHADIYHVAILWTRQYVCPLCST
jgi:hypothetical protein